MNVFSLDDDINLNNTIVTVGKFDGIHKGHEVLFDIMRREALGRQKVVLVFESSPRSFLNGEKNKSIITDGEKQLLCEESDIDVYIRMPLTTEFLSLSPLEFVDKILKGRLGMTALVCGEDFSFGKEALGDVDFLESIKHEYGFALYVIKKEKYNNVDISSTLIREKITEGKIDEVNLLLDHPYTIIGRVRKGKQLGRTLKFPTANVVPDAEKLLPPNGVYHTVVEVGGSRYRAISNIGTNPTVENGSRMKVETHILDFSGDIYGDVMAIEFYRFMRPEFKFENVNMLQDQVTGDIEERKRNKA